MLIVSANESCEHVSIKERVDFISHGRYDFISHILCQKSHCPFFRRLPTFWKNHGQIWELYLFQIVINDSFSFRIHVECAKSCPKFSIRSLHRVLSNPDRSGGLVNGHSSRTRLALPLKDHRKLGLKIFLSKDNQTIFPYSG
jgi:hypothetical protein